MCRQPQKKILFLVKYYKDYRKNILTDLATIL